MKGSEMREIKFRARSAKLPEGWLYGYFAIKDGQCVIINNEGTFPVICKTESQYTGLKDKNGKEIYEGDILKFPNDVDEPPQIIYSNGEWLIKWQRASFRLSGFHKECEIIGNDCENPELLKEVN